MPTIQEEVLAGFLKKLRANADVDPKFVDELRVFLKSGSKLRADDLVAMYVAAKKVGRP